MTELDAFEVRFGAAVRGYAGRVSSDLDPAELAHRIATAEPRGRGLAAVLGWRGVAIPRRAWLLLLLAALLTALVCGMLVAGSQPVRKLPAVVPPVGQLFACPPGSTPDTPGPVDQARPPQVRLAPTAIAFDRRAGRLVVLVIADTALETWTFDVCTNTWTRMHPDREPPGFERASLIYDVDSDVSILVTSERVWVSSPRESRLTNLQPYSGVWTYDLQADTWTEKGAAPIDARLWVYAKLWAYDPLSGLVVAALGPDLWSYHVETDTWTPLRQANVPGDVAFFPCVAYDASVDRIIAYTTLTDRGPEAWLLDLRTGTWSRSRAETPTIVAGWDSLSPAMEYDEAAGRTVVFGNAHLAIYDAKADSWEILAKPVSGWPQPIEMVYDAVNRRLVGVVQGSPGLQGAVDAFDLATRGWTVLLEQGTRQPAPSAK